MPRILCKLPNASTEINGINFSEDHGDMVSESVDETTAKHFASIPGYELLPDKPGLLGDGGQAPTAPEEPAAETRSRKASRTAE